MFGVSFVFCYLLGKSIWDFLYNAFIDLCTVSVSVEKVSCCPLAKSVSKNIVGFFVNFRVKFLVQSLVRSVVESFVKSLVKSLA